jgi:hypothetical protein
MQTRYFGLLAFLTALAPAAANACIGAFGERSIIHSALPNPLPRDTIVAEVEILSGDEAAFYRSGVPARITRLIRGQVSEPLLVLRGGSESDCTVPFGNGLRGYVIAVERGRAANGPLVEPFFAVRGEGFRLADGYQIPEEWRRTPAGW